jgi:hypothetical protein
MTTVQTGFILGLKLPHENSEVAPILRRDSSDGVWSKWSGSAYSMYYLAVVCRLKKPPE